MPPVKQEVCTIKIMFRVESDEVAIGYKKKIEEVLSDGSDVQVQFSIMSLPKEMGLGSQIR